MSAQDAHRIIDISFCGGSREQHAWMVLYNSGLVKMCGFGIQGQMGRNYSTGYLDGSVLMSVLT